MLLPSGDTEAGDGGWPGLSITRTQPTKVAGRVAHASDSSPFPVSRQWVPRPCVFLQGRERCCRPRLVFSVEPVGGWPGLSITRTHPTKWVPHSSRSVRRVGAIPHAAPILTLPKSGTSNSIIPALANNARTGHPPL